MSSDPSELLRRLRLVSGAFRNHGGAQAFRKIETALETMAEMVPVYEKLIALLECAAAHDAEKK